MKGRIFVAAAAVLIALVAFQNCSIASSSHTDMSSLGKTCLATAERAFYDSYYPHLRAQCSQCHDNGGAGISWFASRDSESAFEAFMSTGREKVNMQMVNDGHPGPNNGPGQEGWVAAQTAQWKSIDKQVEDCINATAVTTIPKNNSVQDVAINDNNDTNRRPWKTLEYDLYSEILNPEQKGKIEVVVRIRYRESGPGVVKAGIARAGQPCRNDTAVANCEYLEDIGYEFFNPTARLRAGAATGAQFSVDRLSIMRNGVKLGTVTSFEAIEDVIVFQATEGPLIVSGVSPGITSEKNPATDVFQMRFAEIRDANGRAIGGGPGDPTNPGGPTVPARVTFADLSNAANQYGYFARNCNGCHSGPTPSGGLDLTNYAAAQLRAATIRSRVNNINNPMPRGGLLPQFDRDVISRWVDIGAPQN